MPRFRGAATIKRAPGRASRPRSGAASVIGLDIGTSAVRAIEVCTDPKHRHDGRGRPAVRVFGEMPLPAGAAVDGEVADPAVVGQAIATLWQQLGLRRHDVRVGLASQRVVVRTIELPAMPDDELEAAVRFSAQDHIPIPLDEAVLDFTVLEPVTGVDGPMVRLLLVAAHRDPLDRLIQAATAGGVRVVGVDLVPLALVRALAGHRAAPSGPVGTGGTPAGAADDPTGAVDGDETTGPVTEAIVSVGAGVTSVVVHEGGRPRFVRSVATGGRALTAALADELGLEPAEAEAVKVGGPGVDPDLAARAERILEARIGGIVSEIHGSLNYWMTQTDKSIDRVRLTGGSALAGDLPGRLRLMLGVPVVVVRPEDHLDLEHGLGDTSGPAGGQGERSVNSAGAAGLVAAGLVLGALSERGTSTVTREIDLCPNKVKARPDPRLPRAAMGVGAALVLALGGLTANGFLGLAWEKSRLADQEHSKQSLESELAKYERVRRTRVALDASRARVRVALNGDLDWTGLIEDITRRLPAGVWLSSFDGQVKPPSVAPPAGATDPAADPAAAAPPVVQPAAGVGTLSFSASALDYLSVAAWLDALAEDAAVAAVNVGSLSRAASDGQSVVNFSSTAKITQEAGSDRAERLLPDEPAQVPGGQGPAEVTP